MRLSVFASKKYTWCRKKNFFKTQNFIITTVDCFDANIKTERQNFEIFFETQHLPKDQ